jgi:predicted ester cyclase
MTHQSTTPVTQGPTDSAKATCIRILETISHGDLTDFAEMIHPEAVNREATTQPSAARQRGPAGFYATALWLRAALTEMRWDVNDLVADGELIVAHTTAHGRHVGPFVFYNNDGHIEQVMPPTGKTCSVTQTHWFRMSEGKVIEHWANRDDMGTARQLGWIPPTPRYFARMALAKRRALRAPPMPPATEGAFRAAGAG